MKHKILLTLLFAVSMQFCFGQSYQSIFGESSTSWKISFCNLDMTGTDSLYINNDTLIDGKTYKKIYNYYDNNSLIGGLREDTLLGKIWFYSFYYWNDSTETLIMDLNLSLGDSFYISAAIWPTSTGWSIVDSIYYVDNRKCIQLNNQTNWDDKLTFVEGIGPNITVLYTISNWLNMCPYVICSYKDNELVYISNNSNFIGCDLDYSSIYDKINNIEDIILYPNPIQDIGILKFFNPDNSEYTLSIYNILNERVQQYKTYSNFIIIKKENLKSGIYFYNLINNKTNRKTSGKIIFN